uniref:Uncharacterized protein n=1 Tax=Panagrolaimus davidi TaxID=227884 RepID=A0A914PZ45_9BILA
MTVATTVGGAVAAAAAKEVLKSDRKISLLENLKASLFGGFSPNVVFNVGKTKDESNDIQGQPALHTAYERFRSCIEIQNEKLKTYAFIFTFVLTMFFGYLFWSHSVNERERIHLELEYQQMFQKELVQQQMAQMELTHQQMIEMKLTHQQQIYIIAIFSFVGIVVSFFFGALVAWVIKK